MEEQLDDLAKILANLKASQPSLEELRQANLDADQKLREMLAMTKYPTAKELDAQIKEAYDRLSINHSVRPTIDPTLTARDVAHWMKAEIDQCGYLEQEYAASHIGWSFGERFTRINDNGNMAIATEVLKEFRKLTELTVVWVKREKLWRRRQGCDTWERVVE